MSRTQIYLQPDLDEALDLLAHQRGTSKANIIRMAARRYLQQEQDAGEDSILGMIGLGNAGPGDVSEEHDRILIERDNASS